MRHVIVTRFSIPRSFEEAVASRHCDPAWLERRFQLFRSIYVPSIGRLGVRAILLCSSATRDRVAESLRDLDFVRVVRQDDWWEGWTGSPDQVLTRHDSDDALHEDWFDAVDRADPEAEVICSREFLRLDLRRKRVVRYRRKKPAPLAAFRGGVNPLAHLHEELPNRYRTATVDGPYLLQVAHGENLSTRFPKPFRRGVSIETLQSFGLDPATVLE